MTHQTGKEDVMNKKLKTVICLLMLFSLLTCILPQPAEAQTVRYSKKIISLARNKTVTAKGTVVKNDSKTNVRTVTSYLYKIKVPAGTYVKLQTPNAKNEIEIHKTVKADKSINTMNPIQDFYGKKTHFRVMPAGTYYLYAKKGVRFTWTYAKVAAQTNYCRSRAMKLAAGKKIPVVFTRGNEFRKWYRVSLPSRRQIKVYLNNLTSEYNLFVTVCNSMGIQLKTYNDGDGVTSTCLTKALEKGTYYICVDYYDYESSYDMYFGRMGSLMWR